MAQRKVRILLSGTTQPIFRELFVKKLFEYGKGLIIMESDVKKADLVVDVSLFDGTMDIAEEAEFTAKTALQTQIIKKDIRTYKRAKRNGSK